MQFPQLRHASLQAFFKPIRTPKMEYVNNTRNLEILSNILKMVLINLGKRLTAYEMNYVDKDIILDLEKYLEKKKRKIGNATHGFDRGQHELIVQILRKLRKLEKRYKVK